MNAAAHRLFMFAILGFQLACSAIFLASLLRGSLTSGAQHLPFVVEESVMILASISLTLGPAITVLFIRRNQAVIERLDQQIGAVSGNYQLQVEALFRDWDLSTSESEIAIYAMKGFSNAEIGALRGTSAATVKSQMNAIYRKSGFANRQQLIAFLVEELLQGVDAVKDRPMEQPTTPRAPFVLAQAS